MIKKIIIDYLDKLNIDEKIEKINELKIILHELSPFNKEPVDCVLWVKSDLLTANDYNPNTVAPPEMELLELSIKNDGYTQPIVSWKNNDNYEVVDGFHRNRVGIESKEINERIHGYLPITIINQDRTDRNDRISSTIRHNRARGKHKVESMSDIVIELKNRNWSNSRICKELGMEEDEVLRLCQITGLAELFSDQEFSKSWDLTDSEDDFIPLKTENDFSFFIPKMEFEEFMILFGEWYGNGENTAAFIGIRADESLHRYCAIATWDKTGRQYKDYFWTTKVGKNLFNVYPIYDWKTEDIWVFHAKFPHKQHNDIYDKMYKAGVKLSNQRICQPYGDDQKRGLWLYHILEPETWFKLIARVNGANSGALYIKENGNMTGYNKISKPNGHTWKSFCNLLLQTMPKKTRDHYIYRFKKFISGWKDRGYELIPDESPIELENACWAPSWRRMCKVLLRNDYWCKGLGQTQPKSDAYIKYKEMKKLSKI